MQSVQRLFCKVGGRTWRWLRDAYSQRGGESRLLRIGLFSLEMSACVPVWDSNILSLGDLQGRRGRGSQGEMVFTIVKTASGCPLGTAMPRGSALGQLIHSIALETARVRVKLWLHYLLAMWLQASPLASQDLSLLSCEMDHGIPT